MNRRRITWRADGDANRYTVTQEGEGGNWIASVLLNGELTTMRQEQLMHDMVAGLQPHPDEEESDDIQGTGDDE